jgi:sugar-specific transcriptional regulator TrmB
MEIERILEQTNLRPEEVRIYLSALELGASSASDIAKKAQIQRTYFYDLSKTLIEGGFLRRSKKGKKMIYFAENPEKIVEIERKKLEKLEKAIPELKALYNTSGKKPRISYFEGSEGIDQINNDTLKQKGEIVGFTTPLFVKYKNERLSREYITNRISSKNQVRAIGEMSNEILALQRRDKEELRETRILPQKIFSSNIEIGVYGNKMFVLDYKQEFGFIIEGAEIAKVFKMIFEIVWSSGKIIDK